MAINQNHSKRSRPLVEVVRYNQAERSHSRTLLTTFASQAKASLSLSNLEHKALIPSIARQKSPTVQLNPFRRRFGSSLLISIGPPGKLANAASLEFDQLKIKFMVNKYIF
ncbi:MAG: hypothetical protein HOP23_16460 [Methylococcaceae bacterium]|nr:hypothetical protein [Methylococcaceae bacterium]